MSANPQISNYDFACLSIKIGSKILFPISEEGNHISDQNQLQFYGMGEGVSGHKMMSA